MSLTFHVDEAELLRNVLAPGSTALEFALAHAAMPVDEFAARVGQARARLESGVQILKPDGGRLGALSWRWGNPSRVQAVLKQRAIQGLVAPGDHLHDPPDAIPASLASSDPITRARIVASAEWQPLLVVWYRPEQAWLKLGSPSVELAF